MQLLLKNPKDPNEPRIGTYAEKSMEVHLELQNPKIRKNVEKKLKEVGFTEEESSLGRAKGEQREEKSSGPRRSGRTTSAKPSTTPTTKIEPSVVDKGKGLVSFGPTIRSGKRMENPLAALAKRGRKEKMTREKNLNITDDQDDDEEDLEANLVRRRRGGLTSSEGAST